MAGDVEIVQMLPVTSGLHRAFLGFRASKVGGAGFGSEKAGLRVEGG